MRYVRTLGLCALAALALGAMAASSASAALPEWGQCNEQAEGKYANAGCTVKAHKGHGKYLGNYEWSDTKEAYMPFTIGKTHFETAGGKAITCESGEGEIGLGIAPATERTSPKDVSNIYLTFNGCHEGKNGEGAACVSENYYPDSISNYEDWYSDEEGLQGQIGLITGGSNPTVGLYLAPFAEDRLPIWSAKCTGPLGTVEIGDTAGSSVIGAISPVNEMVGQGYAHQFTITFSGSAGLQSPKRLKREGRRGLVEESLFTSEPMSMSTTLSLIEWDEAPLEIKATR